MLFHFCTHISGLVNAFLLLSPWSPLLVERYVKETCFEGYVGTVGTIMFRKHIGVISGQGIILAWNNSSLYIIEYHSNQSRLHMTILKHTLA